LRSGLARRRKKGRTPWGGDIHSAVGAAQEADDQGEGKPVQPFAAEEEEDDDDEPRCERGKDGSAQGLVDRVVNHLVGELRRLPFDLANPVEDDNGVIDREADQGEERGDDR
jgi:hypothetical protein